MIDAIVREWHDDEGWGVVDAAETPGGCWVHYSHIDVDGYRSLAGVGSVRLDYEPANQDGYQFRATRVAVPGRPSAATGSAQPHMTGAYESTLHIERDD